jgi:hypothetical protein
MIDRAMKQRQSMTEATSATMISNRLSVADGRRRQLRDLLLSAADAARQGRQMRMAARATNRMGRAVRDRVSMLLSAAE